MPSKNIAAKQNAPLSQKLKVVLCWHMHQPQYQERPGGEYQLPWTYLHAIKDYVDMAAHLEAEPRARAVVNFAPTLLEQLDDYAQQVKAFLSNGQPIRDPLLAALAQPVLPSSEGERLTLVSHCLRANEERHIERFEAFSRVAEIARCFVAHPESSLYISDAFLVDVLVWYHLAWLGETVRRTNTSVKKLIAKEHNYSLGDRRQLLKVISELLGGVISRYKQLAERGQIELSVSPYAHPIVPLLVNIQSAREAMPDVELPELEHYPGGEERVRWHLDAGIETFRRYFGFTPQGCWPSEGGVSTETLPLFQSAGFRWVATGEAVLRNSLAQHESTLPEGENRCLHMAYQVGALENTPENTSTSEASTASSTEIDDKKIACFFRDDGLSDLIGFTYSDWHADDAVANLLSHLDNIAEACREMPDAVVSIILDGENAWEYYPENGYYFLDALYRGLVEHPSIEITTFSDCLDSGVAPQQLSGLVAGSWVYGSFSTWIGDADKNRAWDMLGDAKRCFDLVIASGRLSDEQIKVAEQQLAICEGSDWFWWFGDYNSAESVSDFEHLFRQQLTTLYQMLGEEPPEHLSHVFARGGGSPQLGGTMRRGSED